MFVKFRDYQKIVWFIIILALVPGLVFVFSSLSGMSKSGSMFSGDSKIDYGSISGRPISREEFIEAMEEANLRYFFNYGNWPEKNDRTGYNIERETYTRLLLIEKQKEFGIKVSDPAVGQLGAELLKRIGDVPYDLFVKEILQKQRIGAAAFERFVRHDLGVHQLLQVAGLSGKLVPQHEAEAFYRRENLQWVVDVAFFRASNYLATVSINPTNVAQFYTNRMPDYRVPERIRLGFVSFESTNFLAEADKELAKITNLTAQINEFYLRQGTNSYKDTNGIPLPEKEAKEKIKENERHRQALLKARQKAYEFANQLLEQPQHRFDNFEKLSAALGFTLDTTEPFEREKIPKEFKVPATVTRIAAGLTKEEAVSLSPVVGEDTVYVVALKETLPSEMPALDSIRDRVTQDYRHQQTVDAARKAGAEFLTTLTNSLAQGKSFTEICQAAQVQPAVLPPFSLRTTSLPGLDEQVNFTLLKNLAYNLKPGNASQFMPTAEGGFIIFLREKLPVNDEKMKQDLPEFISTLRLQNQNEAFNQWFAKQRELARMTTPLIPNPAKMGATGGQAN